jgi:catechol 2,3-dioxygenase-like lactoylglutathione lyase family enzyme
MFKNTKAFSGFFVDDIVEVRRFYSETLGLRVTEEHGMPTMHIAGSRDTLVYPKEDHSPAVLHDPQLSVKHAGLAPRAKLSGAFFGRTKLTGQGGPDCDLQPGVPSGERNAPTPSTAPATDTSPPASTTSYDPPKPRPSSPPRSCGTYTP